MPDVAYKMYMKIPTWRGKCTFVISILASGKPWLQNEYALIYLII